MAIREIENPGWVIRNPEEGRVPGPPPGRIFWRYNDQNNQVQSFHVDLTNWTKRTADRFNRHVWFGVKVRVRVVRTDVQPEEEVALLTVQAGESGRVNVSGLQVEPLRDRNGDVIIHPDTGEPIMWVPNVRYDEVEIERGSEPVGG